MFFFVVNCSQVLFQENQTIASWKPSKPLETPIGKKTWIVEADICGYQVNSKINLTLSTCGEGYFTCGDGLCIPLIQKCDLRINCEDKSDEFDCSVVDIPKEYSKAIPPPSLVEGKPLTIKMFLDIISFPAIKTEDLTIEVSLRLSLRWNDMRLRYINLKKERSLNTLTSENLKRIWIPSVFFRNAEGNIFTNVDKGSRVDCLRIKEPVLNSKEEADESKFIISC